MTNNVHEAFATMRISSKSKSKSKLKPINTIKYTNETDISLSMAVFLATDNYDYELDTISVTQLIKPLKQLILAKRIPESEKITDITHLAKARIGHSIHEAVEQSWSNDNYKAAMKALGYSDALIKKIIVNPTIEDDITNRIPIYIEKRSYREIDGIKISGRFDLVADGRLEDIKSTSTFNYTNQNSVESYQLQGSIYRWLNPNIIYKDYMAIQYIFTDYAPGKAKTDSNYPTAPIIQQIIPLLSIEDIESYIRHKLSQLKFYENADEADIPQCSDKDLWRKDPVWKYYLNPEKRARSTKNFSNHKDALLFQQKKKNVGIIIEVPGQVIACNYCPAFNICTQKDHYIADGSLKI